MVKIILLFKTLLRPDSKFGILLSEVWLLRIFVWQIWPTAHPYASQASFQTASEIARAEKYQLGWVGLGLLPL